MAYDYEARRTADGDTAGPHAAGATTGSQRPSGWQRFRSGMMEIVLIIVGALVISAILRAFVGQMFVIPSRSMQNTLQVGDRVVAVKAADFHRGDVVVFRDTEHWLPAAQDRRSVPGKVLEFVGLLPNTSSNYLIKRVIGMPGDTVACCNVKGQMTVNGKALDERSYLYSENGQMVEPSTMKFRVTVPKDRMFVMGDHRNASGDSRYHIQDLDPDGYTGAPGFVPLDNVVGPAKAILMPLNRIDGLGTPDTFKGIPDRSGSAPDKARICVGDECSPR
ncbi:signal peptidase I [Cutibacterium avidum]|uniref:signal peptidase I n=1 Tax=Cutibacterium avidum TaxID=33010 RepID=UPI0003B8B0A4|nr:signal peptidase I [Cutibacterium avidum]ERS24647.1 signal peptidase I [Propionibacterium sp. KPL2005]ERS26547.1 signal peptidase I [Propionibacterium sp. KPL2000]ERS34551.1 signal peptidase I [Propionibacterium sp. KPL1838]ERS64827.1 signal peptidase I [Propionibacterium sp. KPL1852]MBS6260942.1 signal peptidase I [Propionibacterium sp.]